MSKTRKGALVAAGITSIACIGDTILYSVLPVHAEAIGISEYTLGIILSINRFTRILSHGVIAVLILRIGPKKVITIGALISSLSTWCYKFVSIPILMICSRVLWGIAYSGFRQSILYYTANINTKRNKAFAQSQFIRPIGPFIILMVGPWLFNIVGYSLAFEWLALVSILAFLGCLFLPKLRLEPEVYHFKSVLKPSKLKVQLSLISFIASGLLVVILYLLFETQNISTATLLTKISLFLLLKRMIGFLLPLVLVKSLDYFKIMTHYYVAYTFMIVGLFCLYLQWYEVGLLMAFIGGAILETTIPIVVLDYNKSNHLEVVTSITFWWDIGKAVGALIGILIYKNLGGDNIFLVLGIGLSIVLLDNLFDNNGKDWRAAVGIL